MTKAVQVVSRIGAILDALLARDSASLVDLSAASGLPVTTTSRLLKTLEREAFVERDYHTKAYFLGRRLLSFAAGTRPRRDIASVLHPILEHLARVTGEDAGIAQLRGEHAVFIDRVEGHHALRIIDVINRPEPLYCGAFRKLLLAFQSNDWINEYITKIAFISFTKNTIVTPDGLWKEIERIRSNGFATSFGERLPDAAGVAAPVFDHSKKVCAAIQIAGPIARINRQAVDRFIGAATKAGEAASRTLSGRPTLTFERAETKVQAQWSKEWQNAKTTSTKRTRSGLLHKRSTRATRPRSSV